MRTSPILADLVAHPDRVNDLTPGHARPLLAEIATLQIPLLTRVPAECGPGVAVDVAARRLGISTEWLYPSRSQSSE